MPYPTAIWDGITRNRSRADDYVTPSPEDFQEIRDELIGVQTHLSTLKDVNGVITLAPAVTKGGDPVVVNINNHLQITTKDIILAIGASAVANVNLGYDIPAGSIVLAAALNIESTITLATATKIGLGITGNLLKYGLVTGGTKNNKATVAITPTALAAAEDLLIAATDNAGAAAGTIQNGSIRVRLTFLTQSALADAA